MGEEWNIKYYGFLEIFKKNKQYVFKKKMHYVWVLGQDKK